jgi:pimeloyl-ACP methyl ester carboxylesterase
MSRLNQALVFSLLLLSMTACVEYPNRQREIPAVSAKPILSLQNPAPPYQVIQRTIFHQDDGYSVEELYLESITVRYWQPEGSGPFPAILLLPGIWGDRVINGFARELAQKGFVCLQFSSQRYLTGLRSAAARLDTLAELIRLQVLEAAQLVEWLSRQPTVNSKRIGVLGISLGAIIGTLLTEAHPQIEAAAYLLGGGNLPEIMISPQGYVKGRIRDRIMLENGWSAEEFKQEAITALKPVDPLTYAGRLDAERILMVNGRFDKVIPYSNAKELWEALGQPDWIILPAGHYTASFFDRYIRYRVARHFLEHLVPK